MVRLFKYQSEKIMIGDRNIFMISFDTLYTNTPIIVWTICGNWKALFCEWTKSENDLFNKESDISDTYSLFVGLGEKGP